MSGGMRIDDHKVWVGAAEKGGVFPSGAKMKQEKSAEGSGHVSNYDDTTEAIRRDQVAGNAKIASKPMKPGYRY